MKKYLAIYIGSLSSEEKQSTSISEDIQQKGMDAWGKWMNENSNSIVDFGGPLGKTKRASVEGISDFSNKMTGYVVVQADSHESAASMFEDHPHFSIFPGDSVEIIEILDIPGQ